MYKLLYTTGIVALLSTSPMMPVMSTMPAFAGGIPEGCIEVIKNYNKDALGYTCRIPGSGPPPIERVAHVSPEPTPPKECPPKDTDGEGDGDGDGDGDTGGGNSDPS